ncbi:MAG: hypothetical protein QF790_04510 [Gammaproteobacteria bacterium]|nr:hypothetical protein [Gammaproteobacteria bacterium]MDP6616411.1 hypothetical protein [Gammaproteobacteria bacterium]
MEIRKEQMKEMIGKSTPNGLDRRDEVVLMIFTILVLLLAVPAMLGVL